MNNSISNSLPSRTFQSSLLTSRTLQSRFEQMHKTAVPAKQNHASVLLHGEKNVSENLEAGPVYKIDTPEILNELILVYRFSQASRSRISSNLVNTAASLRSLNYLR